MAKLVYVCSRTTAHAAVMAQRLEHACARLRPDHLPELPLEFSHAGQISYGLINPAATILRTAQSVALGQIFGDSSTWEQPGSPVPDGTFALVRATADKLELCADAVGTRTLWYYHDDQVLIASSSQRAMVMLLGSFLPESGVLPWMLSTGTLGPSHAWDRRLQRLEPAATVLLDRQTWQIEQRQSPICFQPAPGNAAAPQEQLLAAIEETCAQLPLAAQAWSVPLSGGYDSRGILLLLQRGGHDLARLPTVTWGLKSSLTRAGNDAQVAQRLAAALGVPHRYFATDLSTEPLEKIVRRFLLAGEGRIDHLSAYLDGFQIWKTFYESGITGIIRGDEGFGWSPVSSPLTVRLAVGLWLCADDAKLRKHLPPEMLAQELPVAYRQGPTETLEQWRDRLYHQFRIPVMLAALTELKSAYVEQMNPLLSRQILEVVRSLPDSLRTNKRLFKQIVEQLSPPIEYATSSALAESAEIYSQPAMLALLRDSLASSTARTIFPAELCAYVLSKLESTKTSGSVPRRSWKTRLKSWLPQWAKNRLRDTVVATAIPTASLAFRMYLATAMHEQLLADARELGNPLAHG